MQTFRMYRRVGWVMATLLVGGAVQAQYTGNNQTNIINGAISNWPGNYYVGSNYYQNVLIITNAGVLSNRYGYIGYLTGGSNNAAIVTGTGSVWTNDHDLYVGSSSAGNTLTITDGGTVFSIDAYIGYLSGGSNNAVTVNGTGSTLHSLAGTFYVGAVGVSNTLMIMNGGKVFASEGVIGNSGSNNALTITGTGSVWSSSSLALGDQSSVGNTLTITNGGTALTGNAYIGVLRGTNNSVTINGSGSTWNNSNILYVGYGFSSSSNRLTISNGGTATATNVIVGYDSTSTGSWITISGGNLFVTNSSGAGTLDARRGTVTLNSGSITADNLVLTNGASSVFTFNGGMLQTAGSTVNNGMAFTVGNGTQSATYVMRGGSHTFANGLSIASHGALIGTGYVNNATVNNGGALSPGFSPGTQIFSNLTLNAGAIISNEVFSLASHDLIVATNLTVNGTMTWNLTLTGTALAYTNSMTMLDVGNYIDGTTTDWLSLGGTNLLHEGDSFVMPSTDGSNNFFRISYVGGTGNDVVLTVIPEPANALLLIFASTAYYLRRRIHRKTGRWHV